MQRVLEVRGVGLMSLVIVVKGTRLRSVSVKRGSVYGRIVMESYVPYRIW